MASDPTEPGAEGLAGNAALIRERLPAHVELLTKALRPLIRGVEKIKDPDQLRERVDEVLGEIVLRALQCPDSYRPEKPLVPWLMGIGRKVLSGEFRSERNRSSRFVAGDPEDLEFTKIHAVLEDPSDRAVDQLAVDHWLTQLSPADRLVIEGRYLQGLNYETLASAIGVRNTGAARTRLSRAMQRLKHIAGQTASGVTP